MGRSHRPNRGRRLDLVRVEIWSDVVCPWCYLGHRRFEAALSRLPDLTVEVTWRAFELDPRAPRAPQDLRAVVERKYGTGAYDTMTTRLTALGREAGIDFRFDRTQRVNTFDAHRLLAWSAGQPEHASALAERMFAAYFTEGANVADHETLLRLVSDVGGDRADAAAVLAANGFAEQVRADEALAHDHGISGVPAFLLAERLMIPGAQEVDTFVSVLARASERLDPTSPRSTG